MENDKTTCRTCKHRQRWMNDFSPKVIQVCELKKGRTPMGFKKNQSDWYCLREIWKRNRYEDDRAKCRWLRRPPGRNRRALISNYQKTGVHRRGKGAEKHRQRVFPAEDQEGYPVAQMPQWVSLQRFNVRQFRTIYGGFIEFNGEKICFWKSLYAHAYSSHF